MSAPEQATEIKSILFRTKVKTDEAELQKFVEQEVPDVKITDVTFCKAGEIIRPYGFITFDSVEQTNKALTVLNGKMFKGEVFSVESFNPNVNAQLVKVKDLPVTATEEQVREGFQKFGTISRCVVYKLPYNVASAEVLFTTVEAANAAVKEMNDTEFLSSKIKVMTREQLKNMHQTRHQQPSNTAVSAETAKLVVVQKFPKYITENDIVGWFSKVGKATCSIQKNTAFVSFSTVEEAKKALSYNNSNCRGYIISVSEYTDHPQRSSHNRYASFQQQPQQRQQRQQRQQQRYPNQSFHRSYHHHQQQQQQQQHQQQYQQQHQQQQKEYIEPLTEEELKSDDLKELVGTRIYEYLEKAGSKEAGKVAGMILDMHKSDLRVVNELIKNGKIFSEIEKALQLLSESSKQ